MDRPVVLTAPHYVLGETELDHTAITGFAERVAEFRMKPRANLWGWGTVRRTERAIEDLAVESGAATLASAGLDPAAVEAVVLCSTGFPVGTGVHGAFVERVLTGLGTPDADFVGVGLNRCTNLLAGLHVADAYVRSGRHRRVLVVTTDRVTDETTRMDKFALFSDGAASCLVTSEDPGDQELLGCASATRAGELDWANEINPELSVRVNERLLTPFGLAVTDLAGLLHTNVYKPVVYLKEMQAGFEATQLHLDNITRLGHCFAADPLINLVDRDRAGQLRDGAHYLLAASVPGSRAGVLLRRRAGQ
ncbi:3-oxoacyl-ACP synthase [Actinophytocola xinjiangensis]|uniref:3-oxoacyl-ACP synthase n=1 Tax=Actinophytocola xinjiangensis TaxID=485602 RepID=A0A7Z1B1C2_9PSEU|nr:3-oxoacyl-ACP synthase [Actinophytocola xinjiangensis]OLF14036.1 3-oxoacyl-ACP synthase [Actinophytocola xinjiangensis]